MAKRKQKTGGSKKQKTTAAKPSEVMVLPSTPLIVRLSKLKDGATEQHDAINASFKEEMTPAIEKKGVCRWAFNQAHALKNMKPQKRAVAYYHLMRYLEDLQIEKLADEQVEMFEEQAAERKAEREAGEADTAGQTEAREVDEAPGSPLLN